MMIAPLQNALMPCQIVGVISVVDEIRVLRHIKMKIARGFDTADDEFV